MFNRRTPLLLKHAAGPDVRDFALLAGIEATGRGLLISVMPLTVYRAWGDAASASHVYFLVGLAGLAWGLMVPVITTRIPRRWMFTLAGLFYLGGLAGVAAGGAAGVTAGLLMNSLATVTFLVCFNAYVLDYVTRTDLGRAESTKMTFVALPWTLGPVTGIWLMERWALAPFVVSGLAAVLLIAVFWRLRLGNGKAIARARRPTVSPLAYLGRFLAQPRLVAGWLFAVLRSSGWWVYAVYLPIFCVESGLGDHVAGVAMSMSNAMLFFSPVIRRAVQRWSLRRVIRSAFAVTGTGMIVAAALSPLPWATVACLYLSTSFLIVLDVTGGLPFLMAVRAAERTEMAAVYSSFRDVSGILTPGVAAVVLLVAPLPAIFAACGAGLWVAWALAGTLHPRLGRPHRPAVRLPPAPPLSSS